MKAEAESKTKATGPTVPTDGNDATSNAKQQQQPQPGRGHLPTVITVDTSHGTDATSADGTATGGSGANGDHGSGVGPSESEQRFGQARTPKHANKTRDDSASNQSGRMPSAATGSGHGIQQRQQQQQHAHPHHQTRPPPHGHPHGHPHPHAQQAQRRSPFPPYGQPPRAYDGRPLGGSGAFQPHESRRKPAQAPADRYYDSRGPVQVSPGAGTTVEYHHAGPAPGPPGPPPPGYHVRGGPPVRPDGTYITHPQHPGAPPGAYYDRSRYGSAPYNGQRAAPHGYDGRGPPPPPPSTSHRGFRPPYPHQYSAQQGFSGYPPQDIRGGQPPSWGARQPPPPYHHPYPHGPSGGSTTSPGAGQPGQAASAGGNGNVGTGQPGSSMSREPAPGMRGPGQQYAHGPRHTRRSPHPEHSPRSHHSQYGQPNQHQQQTNAANAPAHDGYRVSRAVSSSFDVGVSKDRTAAHHSSQAASTSTVTSPRRDPAEQSAKPTSQQPTAGKKKSAGNQSKSAADSSNGNGNGNSAGDNDLPDDVSWGQLNQVQSVDEAAMRDRLSKRGVGKDGDDDQPRSNSSSLTNSPTQGIEQRHAKMAEETVAEAARQASSLDSLCSVASAQEPLDTTRAQASVSAQPSSPTSDVGLLDLMKCSSGSSGLLHLPAHQRSQDAYSIEGKRSLDEERGDSNTAGPGQETVSDEMRRAPSAEYDDLKSEDGSQRPTKRAKRSSDALRSTLDSKITKSPLSIACSPPTSPSGLERRGSLGSTTIDPKFSSGDGTAGRLGVKQEYHQSPQPMDASYFDKPPSYSYSIDSAPSIPKEPGHRRGLSLPSLPPRPGSSTSSTITPKDTLTLGVDRDGDNNSYGNGAVPSVPSWEIHAQDSFGGGSLSASGYGLMPNFSFQDYPMLSASESNLGANYGPGPETASGRDSALSQQLTGTTDPKKESLASTAGGEPGMDPRHRGPAPPSQPPIESRNQSFDAYHRGGSFHRSDSMDPSYSDPHGRQPMNDSYLKPPHMHHPSHGPPPHMHSRQGGHQGAFPPHSASWATADSVGSHPSQFRQGPPPSSHYPGYGPRPGYGHGGPPMMRNYSHDSGHTRASPPTGPPPRLHPGQNGPPSAFQPPPEFLAPQNPGLNRRPTMPVYIMPTNHGAGRGGRGHGSTGSAGWSKDDDQRLSDIVKKYKNPRDWEPIAKEHGCGKSAKDCHDRYIRYLKPGVRKGQWTDHEDAIVIEAVTTSSEQPFTRWSDLAQRLPGRVGKQIRDRWVNHLNPNINHLPFSREDDLRLWEGHKELGSRWVEISTKIFNSTRSENHIKNRWYSASFKKFVRNEFGADAYTSGKKADSNAKSKKKAAPTAATSCAAEASKKP